MASSPPGDRPRRDVAATRPHPVTPRDEALGRTADHPGRIPPPGWRAVLRRVWREASSDNLPMAAASCAFFALLALFPALSVLISRERPKEYLAVMTKARRVGRIYIDYLRNRRGSTSICAYSTRAKPEAPVSVPLHWDELADTRRPDFTVANVPARLRALRQDPWKGYEAVRQQLPG